MNLARTLVGLLALLTLACAGLSVVPVQEAGLTENPPAGPAVKIASTLDQRDFQDFSGRGLTPTLAGDDPELRPRAVARGAGPGGGSGNVLLSPDSSVEQIVAQAVGRALRAARFRVLTASDPGFAKAVPLTLGIEQLWMMNEPGAPAWVDAEIRVRISGPIPGLERGAVVEARKKLSRAGWTFGMWQEALGKALDELTRKSQVELEAVRASLDAASSSSS